MRRERYIEYLTYVKEYLTEHGGMAAQNPRHPFRSRFQHTIRVLHWCFRLAEGMEQVEKEVLYTAAIFHDIGYEKEENDRHALRSGRRFMNMPSRTRWTRKFESRWKD